MGRCPIRILFPVAAALAFAACSSVPKADAQPPAQLAAVAGDIVARPNISGFGVARIEDGEVAWTRYYGEMAPGIPVTADTAFNTASVAKTLMAETVLRLVDQGAISLDDPISEYYRHPDLAGDPRYAKLTPRLILSHQAALKNWPYLYEDGKLAFIGEPGSGMINYSGAAIMMLAHYLEERLGKPYPQIVDEVLLSPLGIDEIAVGREAWLEGRVPRPVDGDGTLYQPFNRTGGEELIAVGEWNAADNLYATVPAYARLLTALIDGRGLSLQMQAERETLQSSGSETDLGYECVRPDACPDPLGFGIGWQLFGEPGRAVLNHGGNDFAEHAQVWFSPDTRDGLVMFMNGGNALTAGLDILEVIDPDLLMVRHYRALIEQMQAQEAANSTEEPE